MVCLKKIKEVIVVEGRYDKKNLENIVDATMIETSGFGVFSDKELIGLLSRLAEKRGIIVMTDSDHAGFQIRNYIKNAVKSDNIKHAYIPDRFGKEKRKKTSTREGKLGVEGMRADDIINALIRAGATFEDETPKRGKSGEITKADLYSAGLSGTAGSAERRKMLMKRLDLPENLSSNGLLDVLNALYGREEFSELVQAAAN